MKLLKVALYSGFCALTACGAIGKPAENVANRAVDNLGCKTSQSEMWNSLYRLAEESSAFPAAEDLRYALLKAGQERGLNGALFSAYVDAFVSNYATTVDGIKARFDPQDPDSWKKALAEMEVGIRLTEFHAELNDQISASLSKVKKAEAALQATCKPPIDPIQLPSPEPPDPGTVWDRLLKEQAPEVYGMRRVLAVAYQSCDVLRLPPMDANTPDVEGITDIGPHPQGGRKRDITSVSKLNATDYYYKGQRLAKNSCFDVKSKPLIYNFGGKPATKSSDPNNLDLFTKVNTGGPTLGIDCSAYVFSALAVAGLKMDPDPDKPLKAMQVGGIPSGAFKEPQTNNLRCLKKISVSANTSILPGDVVAINGHVVMIDEIGTDPLAIGGIQSLADCTTAKINPAKFNFTIAQSAPIKNGIGIDRIRGADYMPESSTIRNGLVAYAVAACRAKFGAAPNINSPNLSIVRHVKTPECTAPKPLVMSNEQCISSCEI